MGKDPAFLFYDGDAAKDVSHMSRIERGCYFDIIQAQRKFGRMPEELIRKVLGKDFDECWYSIKICLTCVNHMYFIEWLEKSITDRAEYSKGRRKNRFGGKLPEDEEVVKNEENDTCHTYVAHMENENENESTITYTDVKRLYSSIKMLTGRQFFSDQNLFSLLDKILSSPKEFQQEILMVRSLLEDKFKSEAVPIYAEFKASEEKHDKLGLEIQSKIAIGDKKYDFESNYAKHSDLRMKTRNLAVKFGTIEKFVKNQVSLLTEAYDKSFED